MAIIPTVRMKKETAVITVNADQVEAWEALGYKVLDAKADEPAKQSEPAKGKKAK